MYVDSTITYYKDSVLSRLAIKHGAIENEQKMKKKKKAKWEEFFN